MLERKCVGERNAWKQNVAIASLQKENLGFGIDADIYSPENYDKRAGLVPGLCVSPRRGRLALSVCDAAISSRELATENLEQTDQ